MVLIISEIEELSTDNVLEWLWEIGTPFVRINTEHPWQLERMEQSNDGTNCQWRSGEKTIYLQTLNAVWFRRGYLQNQFFTTPIIEHANKQVRIHLQLEAKTIKRFIYEMLSKKKSLNHPKCYNMNKLIALQNAIEVGFVIPDTLITRSSTDLRAFAINKGNTICKPIQDCIVLNGKTVSQICKVDNVEEDTFFSYSLFQQEISKKAELRVFYLNGKSYAVSVPHIINAKANNLKRIVPYNLPQSEKEKIHKFMNLCSLNSGSLDIILSADNQYVFLEVNPVGQFDYVSKFGNYYIERDIAKYLSEV